MTVPFRRDAPRFRPSAQQRGLGWPACTLAHVTRWASAIVVRTTPHARRSGTPSDRPECATSERAWLARFG